MSRIVSLAAGTVLPLDPEATIDIAARAGFRYVGLRPNCSDMPIGGWAELRRRAGDKGISVFDIEVIRLGVTTRFDIDALIDAGAELGARWLLTVSHYDDSRRTIDILQSMAAQCEATGTLLRPALEFMSFTSVKTMGEAVAIANAASAGVVIDALHLHRSDATPADVAQLMSGPCVPPCYLQACDTNVATVPINELGDEARHRRLIPGTGFLPLAALVAALPIDTAMTAEVQSDALLNSLGTYELSVQCRRSIDELLGFFEPH